MLYIKSYDSVTRECLIRDTEDSSVEFNDICEVSGAIIGLTAIGSIFQVSSVELKMINLLDFDSEDVHIVYENVNTHEKVDKIDKYHYSNIDVEPFTIGALMLKAGSQRTKPTDAFYVKDNRFYIRIDATDYHYLALSYKITDMDLFRKYCIKADVLNRG